MNIVVKITKEDIGFKYCSVKSLLKKFQNLNLIEESLNSFTVKLDTNSKHYSELSYAILWGILSYYKKLKCKKNLISKDSIIPKLKIRHFFDNLTGEKNFYIDPKIPINFESFMPVRASEGDNKDDIIGKILSDTTKNTFQNNNNFHDEIKIQILEIINNAFDHSESNNLAGAVCSLENDILKFCVVDMGQGIRKSFISNPELSEIYKNKSDEQSIAKATQFRISCNPDSHRNPKYTFPNGGIGLYFLKEFTKFHRDGQLVIISKKGYYYIDSNKKEILKNFVNVSWPGTIVYFRTKFTQEKNKNYIELCNKFIDDNNSLVSIA